MVDGMKPLRSSEGSDHQQTTKRESEGATLRRPLKGYALENPMKIALRARFGEKIGFCFRAIDEGI